jgi:hypothetical protein
MAKLTLNSSEWSDIVVCFLYDKMCYPDEVIPAEINLNFNDLAEILKRKALKGILQHYYINIDPQLRTRYRLIMQTMRPDSNNPSTSIIEIRHMTKPKEDSGLISKTISKVGALLKAFISGDKK